MNILRSVLAVLVGFFVGSLVNLALVKAGPAVFPPPAGADMTTPQGIAAALPLLQPEHFLFPWLAHALGTFCGALVAFLLAGPRGVPCAWFIGGLTLLGGVSAAFMIPAPAWFLAADLLGAYLPATWLAIRLGSRLSPPARASTPPAP